MSDDLHSIPAGGVIFEEGSTGTEMFVVASGTVRVTRRRGDTTVVLATLGPGAIFGELGLLESVPRSATVAAAEDAQILAVDSAALMTRIAADPMFALKLLQSMSARIRRLTEELFNMAMSLEREDEARDTAAAIEHDVPGYL